MVAADDVQTEVEAAVDLPHREPTAGRLAAFPPETLFVVDCAGPHCNGANRAAVRLARLGHRVKETIGGAAGWRAEGFALEGKPVSPG